MSDDTPIANVPSPEDSAPKSSLIFVDGSYMTRSEHDVIAAAFMFVHLSRDYLALLEQVVRNPKPEFSGGTVEKQRALLNIMYAVDRCDWPNREWKDGGAR